MAKAAKKHTPTKSKADSSKFGLSIVKDVFPRWHVRLGSSEDAKNELEAFLRTVPSLRLQVSSDGKKRRSVVESPEFWKDAAYLFVQTDVGGVDHLRFHCTDYVDVSDWRTGSDWRTADFLVRADDVERWECLFPAIAAPLPRPSQDKPKRERPQVRRVRQALQELFPPNGRPPVDLTQKAILKRVNENFFKARKWKPAKRDSLARAMGLRP